MVRTEQAQDTRRRVLDAAKQLFLERGYAGTTVAAVAAEAGVSPETIYVSLRSKRGLLEGVIEATILGPEAVPLAQQTALTDIQQLATPRERLRAYIEFCCDVIARTSPVHAVIRGAADSEAFAIDLRENLLRQRLAVHNNQVQLLVADALRPGLTMDQAAQRCCALASPELYHLLTIELGWTHGQHRDWVHGLIQNELFGPG